MSWTRGSAHVVAWAVVGVVSTGLAVRAFAGTGGAWGEIGTVLGIVVPFASVGWLVAARVPGNAVGWLFLAAGAAEALSFTASQVAEQALVRAPGSLPFGPEAAWLSDLTWWPPLIVALPLLLLVFPVGRPLWPPVLWVSLVGLVLAWTSLAAATWPGRGSSYTGRGEVAWVLVVVPLAAAGAVLMGAAFVAALVSVAVRFRRARGLERRQLGWFALGGAGAVAAVPLALAAPEEVTWLAVPALAVFPAAVGAAILREQLFDISLVLNRTLLYGALTLALAGAFVATSAAVGIALGGTGAVVVATAVVAVLAQPLRARLQRAVNRLMFGERHDPYEALARLAERLGGDREPRALLDEAAATIARVLGLSQVEIHTLDGEVAVAGDRAATAEFALDLRHRGERVGRLLVGGPRPGDRVTERDRLLLTRLAREVAAVAHGAALLAELRRSRHRLVEAREEERRRIRRDLHDGLGSSLAAIGAGLEVAMNDPDRLLLGELREACGEAIVEVRALVHGLRPPSLDELGLGGAVAAAVRELCRGGPEPAVENALGDRPLPAAVEVAAYLIACEAVTNVVRHAAAEHCRVTLRADPRELRLEIADDGSGTAAPGNGVGLRSMRDRAEELGGSLRVAPAPGGGTTVLARLPLEVPR